MANNNEDIKRDPENKSGEPKEHKSWLGHIVEEIKEELDELVEEAQNDGGEFSALGNGHINVVHDHHHDHDKKEEDKKEE
jgi:hypothetical protein